MTELADETDLKSVELLVRGGSSPLFGTTEMTTKSVVTLCKLSKAVQLCLLSDVRFKDGRGVAIYLQCHLSPMWL